VNEDSDEEYDTDVIRMIDTPIGGREHLGYFEVSPVVRDPWLEDQPFKIRIRADYGLRTVYSEPGWLYIRDPCVNTELIFQDVEDMETQINASEPSYQEFSHF
jgi:hypothetical protein